MRLRLNGKIKKTLIGVLLLALIVPMVVTACGSESTYDVDRSTQENILLMGQAAVPIYQTENFLARQAIYEYMERMDTPGKLWYVYLLAESGAYIGYHISRTYPISIAVAMSNPMQIKGSSSSRVVIPAPGIDAVYYNGVDPTLYYCFDAASDAMILLTTEFIAYDAPLMLDVPLLRLQME